MTKRILLGFMLAVLLPCGAGAAVRMPAIFSSNMVLQRDVAVPIWGEAGPGETVTVSFAGQRKSLVAGTNGAWRITLDPMPAAAEPRVLTIASGAESGDRAVRYQNVLVGDVWLCSGQSNMVMTMADPSGGGCAYGGVVNWREEIAKANFPTIRHWRGTTWDVCSPDTAGSFSATAFYFAVHLQQAIDVPIGLVNRSASGTVIEAWTPMESLLTVPYARHMWELAHTPDGQRMKADYQARREAFLANREVWMQAPPPRGPRPVGPLFSEGNHLIVYGSPPDYLYRQQIEPLIPYGIRGVLWYQGETSAKMKGGPEAYGELLPALITGWRAAWGRDDLPFLFVQLPAGGGERWVRMRESMAKALRVPGTGMAVTYDLDDLGGGIHSRNKRPVGQRLSLLARALVYGEDVACSGPRCRSMLPEGDKIRLHFDHTGEGLTIDGDALTGFVVAGDDRQFHAATATINGQDVVVGSQDVSKPIAVRYAWEPPVSNGALRNRAGLPAAPFRTDDWLLTSTDAE